MTSTLYDFNFYCVTESKYVDVWAPELPSPLLCPNNSAHTINADSVSIAQTVSQQQFIALEASKGYYQAKSVCVHIPAGATGSIYTQDISWTANILLWTMTLYVSDDSIEDVISLISGPDTTIGYITASAGIGATTITVSSTVITNVTRGLNITLYDGVNRNELGEITAINTSTNTLTFQTATTTAFSPGTLVYLNIHTIKDFQICDTMMSNQGITFGAKGFKGKELPANMIVRFKNTNNNGLAKEITFKVEYYIIG